jgi:CHAT domain-containing protein
MIAAQLHHDVEAERLFREVELDQNGSASLKWRSERELARFYEDTNRMDKADVEYRAAVATFEGARASLRSNDFQLPFSNNGYRIYDGYVHFLVMQGRIEDALRWADFSRGRTLAEGMGLLSPRNSLPPALSPRLIAQREKYTVLFYWLGEKRSYLWAITPQKIGLFTLPPAVEIEAAVRRYREALGGVQDVLESANQDGLALYQVLIAPAQAQLPKNGQVVIIPDGSLNNLNFETLLVSEPKRHYWIEDATIVNAGSLRLLNSSPTRTKPEIRNLLLIGNSVAPSAKYPELPKAATQVEMVAGHFPPARRRVLTREQATPAAYLANQPERFSEIHFVAHGTASRLSPLDSAIVLSKSNKQDDSFKLYARDIVRHPLRAELVTISACYGAEGRSYSGEGLVGLSWAFLKAGAHHVVAALWEATDASTVQLMERFYDEMEKGASPDAALRTAKLSLLHSNFHNPFYWAPFQLYVGSYRSNDSTVIRQRPPQSGVSTY